MTGPRVTFASHLSDDQLREAVEELFENADGERGLDPDGVVLTLASSLPGPISRWSRKTCAVQAIYEEIASRWMHPKVSNRVYFYQGKTVEIATLIIEERLNSKEVLELAHLPLNGTMLLDSDNHVRRVA